LNNLFPVLNPLLSATGCGTEATYLGAIACGAEL
jgi:hypothetical protein